MLLNAKLYAIGAVLLVAVFGVQEYRINSIKTELAEVKADAAEDAKNYAEERTRLMADNLTLSEAARDAENFAREAIAKEKERADEKVQLANADAKRMSERLRLATEEARELAKRISGTPSDAAPQSPAERGDGPFVPATIGQEDVSEAERADVIRIRYLECVNDYNIFKSEYERYTATVEKISKERSEAQGRKDAP